MTAVNKIKGFFVVSLPADLDRKDARRKVFLIAFPAIAELFLLQIASIVDMAMVSSLGEHAIAAINYSYQPRFASQMLFAAINVGATSLVARFNGEGNRKNASLVLRQAILLSTVFGIITAATMIIFSEKMIIGMGAIEPETIKNGTVYLQIQMLTHTFLVITMSITASLRGIGLTKVSFFYNVISNIVNIIFNYLLINGIWFFPRLEVAGASIATSIGQIVAFVIAIMYIRKPSNYLSFRFRQLFSVDREIIRRIIKIAIPAFIEQVIMRVGMIIYVTTISSLGTIVFATHSIAIQFLNFSYLNGQAFGIAATSLLGLSLGEKKVSHAKAYTNYCKQISIYVAFAIGLVLFLFGKPLMNIFSNDQDVINEGAKVLMIVSLLQPMQASQLVLNGALRGAGDTKAVAVITLIGILFVRPIFSKVLVYGVGMGLMGAWIAMTLDQTIRFIYARSRFNSGKWAKIKI